MLQGRFLFYLSVISIFGESVSWMKNLSSRRVKFQFSFQCISMLKKLKLNSRRSFVSLDFDDPTRTPRIERTTTRRD